MKVSSTLGGVAGAAALTVVNEVVKKISADAPRLDLLGENALARFMKGNDFVSKTTEKLFPLAGDLVSNSLFYGMARGNTPSNTLIRGTLLGLGAGIAAVALPQKLDLDAKHTAKTTQTKIMTVAWYLLGGLVAAAVINTIDRYDDPKQPDELVKTATDKSKLLAKTVVKKVASTL